MTHQCIEIRVNQQTTVYTLSNWFNYVIVKNFEGFTQIVDEILCVQCERKELINSFHIQLTHYYHNGDIEAGFHVPRIFLRNSETQN